MAVDELARTAIHGLLTATFPRLLVAFARPSGQPQPREAPRTVGGAGTGRREAKGWKQEENLRQQKPHGPRAAGAAEEESRSAAQHAKERRAAARWLATDPFGYLILMRLSMQPLTLMLYSHVDISSERWEVQQRVAVARRDLNLSG